MNRIREQPELVQPTERAFALGFEVAAVGAGGHRNALIRTANARTETIEGISVRTPMRNRRAFLELEAAVRAAPDAQLSARWLHLPMPRATGRVE